MNATIAVDPALVDAVDVARAALLEEVPATQVGDHVASHGEQEGSLTHVFTATHPGYVGWQWAVTLSGGGEGRVTVDEVVLLPGESAIVAPPWVPYKERLQPGDLSPGDLLPVDDDDPRLVPTYLVGEEMGEVDRAQVKGVAADLGLGRVRTLSVEGQDMAAERWHAGPGGPEAPVAKSAPDSCWSCGFLVRLSGALSDMFGVCANGNANDDGRVVTYDHGCGAHSEVKLARKQQPIPVPEHAFDSFSVDLETF